jgi:hypothetical protein
MLVAALLFLYRSNRIGPAKMERLVPAEVAARLYANALNALAHGDEGLEPAVRIAGSVPGYAPDTANLESAVAAVRQTMA